LNTGIGSTFCQKVHPDMTKEERRKAQNCCIIEHIATGVLTGAGAIVLWRQIIKKEKVNIEEVLTGAGIGAIVGFGAAWYMCFSSFSDFNSQPVKGYKVKTSKTYNVKIEDFSVSPTTVYKNDKKDDKKIIVYAGDTISLKGSYIVTAPKGITDLKVMESRILQVYDDKEKKFVNPKEALNKIRGNKVNTSGKAEKNEIPGKEITAEAGILRKADGNLDVPAQAVPGCYRLIFEVSSEGKSDSVSKEFNIKKRG